MAQIRDMIGYRMMAPQKWIDRHQDSEVVNRVQIYEDFGEGYQEEKSYFVPEAYRGEELIVLKLQVGKDVKVLRVDPAFCSCIVEVTEMKWNGEAIPFEKQKIFAINGRMAKPATMIFATSDPNINIDLQGFDSQENNTLSMEMKIVRVPETMAEKLSGSIRKLF